MPLALPMLSNAPRPGIATLARATPFGGGRARGGEGRIGDGVGAESTIDDGADNATACHVLAGLNALLSGDMINRIELGFIERDGNAFAFFWHVFCLLITHYLIPFDESFLFLPPLDHPLWGSAR